MASSGFYILKRLQNSSKLEVVGYLLIGLLILSIKAILKRSGFDLELGNGLFAFFGDLVSVYASVMGLIVIVTSIKTLFTPKK